MAIETQRFDHTAGRLCLDYLNTISQYEPDRGEDLRTFTDVVAWVREFELIDAEESARAMEIPEREQEAGRLRAIGLRAALRRMALGLAAGRPVPAEDATLFGTWLGEALSGARMFEDNGSVRWEWAARGGTANSVLWPVVLDAAELFTSEAVKRVGVCAADDCDWVFLRQARGRQRRWCSMSGCGNRAKARRHYERLKSRS